MYTAACAMPPPARARGASALAERLIDEGLRLEAHLRVTFRDGPTGRRAALINGPDFIPSARRWSKTGTDTQGSC
jgi:hypothetical protein